MKLPVKRERDRNRLMDYYDGFWQLNLGIYLVDCNFCSGIKSF